MNARFSTAVHILTLLASRPEERLTSEFIALSVGTNPVVIRRQLSFLREAGFVDSKGARGGGWELARNAEDIRLDAVKIALGEEDAFRMHRNDPHPDCFVGQHVRSALEAVYEGAEQAILQSLRAVTIHDMLASTRKHAKVRKLPKRTPKLQR